MTRLRTQEDDINSVISGLKLELDSERPPSSSNQSLTMTSNFSIGTVDVEDLRQQLAQASIELEEQKASFKRNYSKYHKELEEVYTDIDYQTQEEKKARVKINQLENDLEHQLKRLDIICKSKGMQRPKRPAILPEKPGRGSSYVSPYRRNNNGSGSATNNNYSPVGSRNLSNNSQNKQRYGYRQSPQMNTPPQRRGVGGTSPGISNTQPRNASNKSGSRYYSPGAQQTTNSAAINRNRLNNNSGTRYQSPG